MRAGLVRFSVDHPKTVLAAVLGATLLFGLQFRKIKTDTDPKNMLPASSPVRVHNAEVEKWFGLHPDMLVLGLVSEQGVLNPETLRRVERLTQAVTQIPGVVERDTLSLSTVDNVTVENDRMTLRPVTAEDAADAEGRRRLEESLRGNPLMAERFLSKDGTATALYIPLEPGANGKAVADRIREILKQHPGPEEAFLAGDPVARDTFGAEMFRQMGVFSPIAGLIMCAALFLMFRSGWLVAANMAVAMISIVWAMGALIGAGSPVHIMSSMIPVFLMAISTDTVHIFNEFYFRFREQNGRRAAILDTMAAVGSPVVYSDVTTAAGFASLAFGGIVPVRVFGLSVAFGALVVLLLSFTFVPALMALIPEKKIASAARREEPDGSAWLLRVGRWGFFHRRLVLGAGAAALLLSLAGMARIRVNNNMVAWFKADSDIRRADRVMNEKLGGTSVGYLVLSAPEEGFFKRPEALRFLEALQREVEREPLVGKTTSVADFVKRLHRALRRDDPAFEAIPDSPDLAAQALFLFGLSGRASDLDNVVDYPYQKANVIVQMKSWDAGVMRRVLQRAQAFARQNAPPGVTLEPAGIAHFNRVWNDEVLWDMVGGFALSLVLVLGILVLEYRSLLWGLVSFVPLIGTILFIYGAVGLLGKDFDMPISVLSTLSLGMAIDFAIHFVGRFRQRFQERGDLEDALLWTVGRPGQGILRNAALFALGFSVMVFASLTPYITVGLFMAAIMILSSIATLLYLPALIFIFRRPLGLMARAHSEKNQGGSS
jgi:predicted RND superfamily exporter protein